MKRIAMLLLVLPACCAGCASRLVTNTPRSAIEQMLLSRAVDMALEKFEMPEVANRKVFVDVANLKAYDAEYIRLAVRVRMAQLGAVVVDAAAGADLVAEVACGALGTEFKSAMIGLPPLPVPNSPVPLPESPLYRSTERTGIVKLLIFLHEKGKFVASAHYYAKADRDETFLLWWRSQKKDDVREGWERADAKLKAAP